MLLCWWLLLTMALAENEESDNTGRIFYCRAAGARGDLISLFFATSTCANTALGAPFSPPSECVSPSPKDVTHLHKNHLFCHGNGVNKWIPSEALTALQSQHFLMQPRVTPEETIAASGWCTLIYSWVADSWLLFLLLLFSSFLFSLSCPYLPTYQSSSSYKPVRQDREE